MILCLHSRIKNGIHITIHFIRDTYFCICFVNKISFVHLVKIRVEKMYRVKKILRYNDKRKNTRKLRVQEYSSECP